MGRWVGGWKCVCVCVRACMRACVCVCVSDPHFGQLLRCEHKGIVNITKLYIESGFKYDSVKNIDFIHVSVSEARIFANHYVYSLFTRWQQLATKKLITIHSPDGSTPRPLNT